MQDRRRYIATVLLVLIGVGASTTLATTKWKANEEITGGAPQQTVAALWAIMDLLIVVAWVGAVLIITVAWVGRLLAASSRPATPQLPKIQTYEKDGWQVGPTMSTEPTDPQ